MAELKLLTVPIDKVRPNEWNPNRPTERVKKAIHESIEEYGFIDPVTVRLVGDEYEIVDGEHRYLDYLASGKAEIEVIALDLTDDEAKKLTVILNETRGRADVVDLAFLLSSLDMEHEKLLKGLPYDEAGLQALLKLADADWRERLQGSTADDALEKWAHVRASLPPGVLPLVEDALTKFYADDGRVRDERSEVALGLFIEAMAADFLAGP